ncbi:asparagine synthase-related protein [Halobaculum sp. EA56]|uniref:asparagine synthase-related protein n=1 Tax=Halobaculum sp. EA56 TaxID=3421648 RepID=UPI003EB87E75
MVGACGVIGGEHPIEGLSDSLVRTGDERVDTYEDGEVRLRSVRHRSRSGENPGRSPDGGALVWVWGNVLGTQLDETHRPRPLDEPVPTYCARLYEEHGLECIERLNGDFVGIVYDRERSTVSLFTDRLGTRPLFVTEADDGGVVFSSHVQSLDRYPAVSLSFDDEYVAEHLSWRGGPLGVKTPFEGVEAVLPGTVTTYDLADGSVERDTYWRPRPSTDREFDGFDGFLGEFVERFRAATEALTRDRSKEYGILLSGGSDARLVLAALPDDLDVTAFHMADWMSREARVAERIALEKGIEFHFLRRDPDYIGRVLDSSPEYWNFQQLFNQAWAEGFIDEIRSEVDVLLTGHFMDTMYKGLFVPVRHVDLGPLGVRELPVELPITSVEEYHEELGCRVPGYLDTDVDLAAVARRNVRHTDDGVEAYGVQYDSFHDFVLARLHYPATTDPLFRQCLREGLELRVPALDRRMIDLWDAMPTRYKIRRNVVNAAVAKLDADLASIPHADSGVAAGRSRFAHLLGHVPMNALAGLSPFDAVPADHLNHHPWGNQSQLIRERDYVADALDESEELIRALPFLDGDEVRECYEMHLDGANMTKYLYRLVTFLKAPVTGRIAGMGNGAGDDAVEGEVTSDAAAGDTRASDRRRLRGDADDD